MSFAYIEFTNGPNAGQTYEVDVEIDGLKYFQHYRLEISSVTRRDFDGGFRAVYDRLLNSGSFSFAEGQVYMVTLCEAPVRIHNNNNNNSNSGSSETPIDDDMLRLLREYETAVESGYNRSFNDFQSEKDAEYAALLAAQLNP